MRHTANIAGHATELWIRRLPVLYDAERAFVHLYGDSDWAFWLDTASRDGRGRFSFMGDSTGPLGSAVTYSVRDRGVRVRGSTGVAVFDESIFDYLARELEARTTARNDLPFDFNCGFAGYFGYELKAECDAVGAHPSPLPDAAFIFADRLIAFDHAERCTWLVCLAPEGDAAAKRWFSHVIEGLPTLPPLDEPPAMEWPTGSGDEAARPTFGLRRSPAQYLEDIAICQDRLVAGESYEICLTNKAVAAPVGDPLTIYRTLRRSNPAPFGAFMRFGGTTVLSSSPERFLRVTPDRRVEARPIKGTSPRGADLEEDARLAAALAADEKSRAENVTIVDLVRNDLGVVCEAGTVKPEEMMRVETYATLHHLVSTIRGHLRPDTSLLQCIRACFPPGSMTGAPKRRTMEILDHLEGEARGVYSGAIGYLGLGGGCDLSVAIRTIVIDGKKATVGCGGAIVLDSDPRQELEEMLLKAWAPMRAIDPGLFHQPGPLFACGGSPMEGIGPT